MNIIMALPRTKTGKNAFLGRGRAIDKHCTIYGYERYLGNAAINVKLNEVTRMHRVPKDIVLDGILVPVKLLEEAFRSHEYCTQIQHNVSPI